jgi:helicase
MPRLYLRRGEAETYDLVAHERHDAFLTEVPDPWYEPDDYAFFLSEVKTASILHDWICERPEREICDFYDIGPGDLHRLRETAQWLGFAFREIARVKGEPWGELDSLTFRLTHGVGAELVELVRIRGIGRVRARSLYALGIKSPEDVIKAPLERLARILCQKTAVAFKGGGWRQRVGA